ncbi:MAG: RtcB family protein [Planctomycetes bacterium]|nr:RtcB family protein [Planctomycetota bacterium]MBI3832942.1 RtcB family protein [Planctomycetota bacterium]
MNESYSGPLERLDGNRWRIPKSYKPGMRVDGIIYANDVLIEAIKGDKSPEQVANVATLPGIVRYSLAMPDIHWGYGFCIGGVAATDPEQGGVISPGGVGYDINCGVRLIRTNIKFTDAKNKIEQLVNQLFRDVPCGVGQGGIVKFNKSELCKLMAEGSRYVVKRGFGWESDIEATEAHGLIEGADPSLVSDRALQRGSDQCGTLGSGNHFMEVQVVEKIDDPQAAAVMGLVEGNLTVMIHSGSRGLGYQVCEDALHELQDTPRKYGIDLPDKQLSCAPVHSNEGQRYLKTMRAAANFAWCSRQIMTHLAREAFARVFETPAERLQMNLVYDVAHNIAKMEPYDVDGVSTSLCVHRKGATRAFPPGHPELPERYRPIGQPVLVPGDMGRASYVLVGQPGSMEHTFGSSCHGAGRRMSRGAAIRASKGRSIKKELLDRGVIARARGRTGLEEEQPDAYKDVTHVVGVLHDAHISRKVAKLRPIGVIKG